MTPTIPCPLCGRPMYRAHRSKGGYEVYRCMAEKCPGKREFKLSWLNKRRLAMGKEAKW